MRIDRADIRVTQPPLAGAAAGPQGPRAQPGQDVVVDIGVPSAPPAEVRAEVEQASRIAARMALENRELHFHKDESSGRVIVQVRDLAGTVIRTIPPSSALEMLTAAGAR